MLPYPLYLFTHNKIPLCLIAMYFASSLRGWRIPRNCGERSYVATFGAVNQRARCPTVKSLRSNSPEVQKGRTPSRLTLASYRLLLPTHWSTAPLALNLPGVYYIHCTSLKILPPLAPRAYEPTLTGRHSRSVGYLGGLALSKELTPGAPAS